MRGLHHRAPAGVPHWTPETGVVCSARSVVVEAGDRRLVDGIDLTLHAGELVALVGPNGAGKSTLVRALAGDQRTSAGQVRIDGADIGDWSGVALARRRAVLPQQATIAFPFTVREVVTMGRAPWARTAAAGDDDEVIAAALADTDMTSMADRHLPTLSGGERARAMLARVLAQATQVLLLDEPTAALDIHHHELVLSVVRQRVGQGAAALVVLHDLSAAARHADRVVVLDHGRIAADGPPTDALDAELLSRTYQHPLEVVTLPAGGGLVVRASG